MMGSMALILSHISALEYWLSVSLKNEEYVRMRQEQMLISTPPQFDHEINERFYFISLPVHVLTSGDAIRRNSSKVICHTHTHPLPKNSILRIGQGLFVVCPELMFIQNASTLSRIELIRLGYELCGTYRSKNETQYECDSLTTVKRLKSFIQNASNINGVEKARAALSYIAEKSASPMETALSMLLCLPYRLGGYGLPQPHLNFTIHSNTISNYTGSYICDLYWEKEKLAVEYDSTQFHADAFHMKKDSTKRNELLGSGIHVVAVHSDDLMYRANMDKTAHLIASLISKKIRLTEPRFTHRNNELRQCIFKDFYTDWLH